MQDTLRSNFKASSDIYSRIKWAHYLDRPMSDPYVIPAAMEFEMHLRTLIRFDVLVNGGGAVTLQFQRSPFKPLTRTVFVPWNQIVVLPPVVMILSKEGESYKSNQPPSPAVGKHRASDMYCGFFFLFFSFSLFFFF